MTRRPRATLRILLLVTVLLSLSAALSGWLLGPTSTWARARDLSNAQQRWRLRPFGQYQLDMMDKNCTQHIQIHNERVLKVAPNRCEAPPRSISDLFTLIQRDGSVSHPCIFQGCICDDVIHIQANYDQDLGFPLRMLVLIRAEPNWRHREFWEAAWKNKRIPNCDSLAEGSKIIQVLKITPHE